MTSRDQLLRLVQSLPDEQADELLKLAEQLYIVPDQRRPLPAFVGVGDSGRTDISSITTISSLTGSERSDPVIIVDTGVLYALADRRDAHHAACVRWFVAAGLQRRRPLVVPPLVVAEVCYLTGKYLGSVAEATALDAFADGSLTLGELLPEDVVRMAALVRQYSDLRLGGTDAAVIATA